LTLFHKITHFVKLCNFYDTVMIADIMCRFRHTAIDVRGTEHIDSSQYPQLGGWR